MSTFHSLLSMSLNRKLGTLINQSTWPSLTGWANTGTTNSFSGGEMNLSGGSLNFAKYIVNTDYGTTNLMDWKITCIFRPQQIDATNRAFVIGVQSNGLNFPHSAQAAIGFGTTAGVNGLVRIFKDGTILATGASLMSSLNVNDRIQLEFVRSGWTFTLTATNLTQTSVVPVSVSFTVNGSITSNAILTPGRFAIYAFSGTQIVENYVVTTTAWKYPKSIFVGDSKTEGFSVTLLSNAYPALTYSSSSNKYNVVAKANNEIGECLGAIHEVVAMQPTYCLLNFGSNDLRFGVASATWQANYLSYVTQLKNAGIIPIHILPPKEVSLDVTPIYTYITSNYTGDLMVDCYTGWNTGTMLVADGIHPNQTGENYIQSQIIATVPQIL
jgi:lysophospholipase L1-like esterase